ncbi:MAG: type II toxin-antitoxin system HicA family toxin [Bacteroidales bacterium]|nr:type II toxin-antitoxin system HicA family toxin [Bacteroidales bacterium]
MKSSELHRIIRQNGWIQIPKRGKGSHVRYQKEGKIYTVPFHKGKEIENTFAKKILHELGIDL